MPQMGDGGLAPPPGLDTEAGHARPESNFKGVSNVHETNNNDVWLKKGGLVLIFRAAALLFSFLAFILMVTLNGFTYYSAYSYAFSISLFMMVYGAVMVGIKGHEILTGQQVFPPITSIWVEFIGDQIMALLLLSSASAGAGLVPYDQTGASIAMSFLAFFSLQPAALFSGYHFAIHISKS